MKKVFCLAFAVFVLTVMCFSTMPARAAEVSFNGQWRVRGFAFDIDGEKVENESQSTSYWDQRFRLYITAKANDNLKGVIRMLSPNHVSCSVDSGDIWGDVNPKAVLWDLAYLDFDVPQTQFNVKVGRQGIDLGNYIVLGSCKTYDALMVSTAVQNVNLSLFTAKLNEGTTGASDFDDEDLYGIALNFKAAPNITLGAFGVMGSDGDVTDIGYMSNDLVDAIQDIEDSAVTTDMVGRDSADAMWLGLTGDMDFNPIKVKLEFDYSKITLVDSDVTNLPDYEITGYAFFADVCADLPMAKVGANLLYTSGHDKDDSSTTESDQFIPISSHFSERQAYDHIVMYRGIIGANDHAIGNLTAIQLYAFKDLTPQLSGKFSVQKYNFTNQPEWATGDDLGTEIDVLLAYKLYDNLTFTGTGAYWLTTDDVFGPDNENCWLLKHEILYTF
ncbi:MAG: hypothetical protein ACMUIM_00190 [bacterium]